MIERWELSPSPQDKDPHRYKVRVRGTEDSVQSLLSRIPARCGRPFVTLARDYNWAFYIHSLSSHYRAKTIDLLRELSPSGRILEREAAPAVGGLRHPEALPEAPRPAVSEGEEPWAPSRLNPAFVFSEFIVGPNARFAHAAAKVVAENPGKIYNPFFVSGPEGTGKTHLVQAVAHQLLERDPGAALLYIKAQKLAGLIGEARGRQMLNRLRSRLLGLDLLIVDDLHRLDTDEATEEELALVWGELQESGRQLILAAERPPRELERIGEPLRNFLDGGLAVALKELGRGTCIAVLKKRSEEMDLRLDDDEISFLAESAAFNIRKIDGLLRKVHAQVHIARQRADLEFLKRIVNPDEPAVPEVSEEEEGQATAAPVAPKLKASEVLERLRKAVTAAPAVPPAAPKPAREEIETPRPAEPPPAPSAAVPQMEKTQAIPAATAQTPPEAKTAPSRVPESAKIEPPPPPGEIKTEIAPAAAKPAAPTPSPETAKPPEKDAPVAAPAGPTAEPSAPPEKSVALAAFYPEGQEKALSICLEKLSGVIGKYKLKLKLDVRARKAYDPGGKLDEGIIPRECAAAQCPVALAVGPSDASAVEFNRRAALSAAKEKISLHIVPWSDLAKDSAYLNYALELSLFASPRKGPVTAYVADPAVTR